MVELVNEIKWRGYMKLKEENLLKQICDQARQIRYREFSVTKARVVPTLDSSDLTFGTTGKAFYGTVLDIDIRHSTDLLNNHRYTTVAKMLMAYYNAIVRVAKETGGEIRSFNGDSLLVFIWAILYLLLTERFELHS